MLPIRLALLMLVLSAFALLPVAAQEATPEVTVEATDLSLTQTYTSEDGSASVSYPAGWVLENLPVEAGVYLNLFVANTQDALDNGQNLFEGDLQSGQVSLLMAVADVEVVAEQVPGLTADMTAQDLLEALSETVDTSGDSPLQFSDVGAIRLGERRGARLNAILNDESVGMAIAYIENDLLVLMIVNTAPGELERWELVALDVINSVVYSPVEATPEVTAEATEVVVDPTPDAPDGDALELSGDFVSSDERLTLHYPTDWVVREAGTGSVFVASDQTALEKFFGDELTSGQVQVYIEMTTPEQLGQNIDADFTNLDSPFKVMQGVLKVATDPLNFGVIEALEVGGMSAATVGYQTDGFAGRAWVIEYQPGELILVQLITAPDESALWEATALAIAESIVYSG